jgi:hypothetical protein
MKRQEKSDLLKLIGKVSREKFREKDMGEKVYRDQSVYDRDSEKEDARREIQEALEELEYQQKNSGLPENQKYSEAPQ